MEIIIGIIGIIGGMCGIAGFALSIIAYNRQKRNDRLMFLADRIFDSSIPRELRQPFYEEYISMKGATYARLAVFDDECRNAGAPTNAAEYNEGAKALA